MASTLNMSLYQYVFVVLSITLSIIFNSNMYLTEALNGGFSVELIHRDSPKSPFYNSSETQIERMINALHRSFERVKHFYPEDVVNHRVIQAPITNTNGEYLMKFSIGTPKVNVMATADIGSDLVWVQCTPCKKCYKQTDPIFNPSKSKTYKVASCTSKVCKLIKNNGCRKNALSLKCQYKLSYVDKSVTSGEIAQETFTFGTNVKNSPAGIDKIIFGCGHDNQGNFLNPKSAGVVGLGNGAISLTSQLGAVIDNKFSYCLVPEHNIPSLLNFGENVVVSGPGTVSTPLASGPSSSYYYVSLKGMTVVSKRLDFDNGVGNAGNILLDTGTTLTYLPPDFYSELESLVASQISLQRVTGSRSLLPGQKLCYNSSPSTFKAPQITVHFAGADIVLNQHNTFEFIGGLMCFNFDVDHYSSVYGSAAQTNFLIGIDRKKNVVSFKPTECSKLQS